MKVFNLYQRGSSYGEYTCGGTADSEAVCTNLTVEPNNLDFWAMGTNCRNAYMTIFDQFRIKSVTWTFWIEDTARYTEENYAIPEITYAYNPDCAGRDPP